MAKKDGNGNSNGAMVAFDASRFEVSTANMKRGAGNRVAFLRMDKSGDWYHGVDNIPVDDEDRLYVDPMGSVHGWQCWADTDIDGVQPDLLDSVVVPTYEPLPPMPDKVPMNGRPWTEMRGLSAIMGGRKMVYTTTSLGGLDAVASLGEALRAQYAKNPKKMIPVVRLANDSYRHKKYGKTYVPVFDVTGWVSEAPALEATAEHDEPAPPARVPKAPPVAAKKVAAKTTRRAA